MWWRLIFVLVVVVLWLESFSLRSRRIHVFNILPSQFSSLELPYFLWLWVDSPALFNNYSSRPHGLWAIGSETMSTSQKYRDKTTLASKTGFSRHCFGFQSRSFTLLVDYNIYPSSNSTNQHAELALTTRGICSRSSRVQTRGHACKPTDVNWLSLASFIWIISCVFEWSTCRLAGMS